ncbi:motility associated factor glycosyltransferase family protein [Tepidibacter thalassicus]|uniref:Uncharacterized conserved protein n=1 Tax=Tepidibacter thalassicus DSM 15285 TaxID=1123350 RepID=A0A1M5R3Z2_9FIRM|nr:6-hydroxymethylpterin diphosphokinase MptE-like protein [Tepidibacter thalassicus]SHH20699.1 Uncharacterized conserved protein [Tepidibacter thalassicus DSM 15285]
MIINLEKAKKRGHTLKVNYNGREFYIHSKYDPINEAINTFKDINKYNADTIFVLFGGGLGYNLLQLYGIITEKSNVILIEPNKEIFSIAMQNSEYENVINKKNVQIIIGENIARFKYLLNNILNENQYRNIKMYKLNSYENIYRSYFNELERVVKLYNDQLLFHIDTANILADKISENAIMNIYHIVNKGNSINKLKNVFKDKPAIIVSAGPSLEKNIDKLKYIQNKALIIAGVRTLKPLLQRGIKPHILCNIDPNDIAYTLVEKYISNDIPLITLIHSNNKLINNYKGKVVFTNDKYYEDLIYKLENEKYDIIESGGSVANYSTAIANYLGCNPIVFIGQDLAYTDNKYHSDSASISENKIDQNEKDLIKVKDIHGEDILTSSSLYSFLCWFEEFIQKNNDKHFINATEGGVDIKGTNIMSLEDVIKRYCSCEFNPKNVIDSVVKYKYVSGDEINNKIDVLNKIYDNLQIIKECINENINLSMKLVDYYNENIDVDINCVLNRMDEIDELIESYKVENNLLVYCLQPSMINITLNYGEKINENEREASIRISKRNLGMYKARYEVILKMEHYLKRLIDKIC